jgi:hypothetical protein
MSLYFLRSSPYISQCLHTGESCAVKCLYIRFNIRALKYENVKYVAIIHLIS